MNRNLQKLDEIFNSAHQSFEESPSTELWDKINAELDRKDAEKYKRRFIGWKRMAIALLLLLSGFALYESGIIVHSSGKKHDGEMANKKIEKEESQVKSNIPVETSNNQKVVNSHPDMRGDNEKNTPLKVQTLPQTEYRIANSTIKENKLSQNPQTLTFNSENQKSKHLVQQSLQKNRKTELTMSASDTDNINVNSISDLTGWKTPTLKRNMAFSVKNISLLKTISQQLSPNQKVTPKIPDSVLAECLVKQQFKNKKNKFKPYWSVTGIVSNDWARYKLDNDVQDNNGNPQNEKEEINNRENHESSVSTGIVATRQLTEHIGVKTGLIYSNTAIAVDPQKMYAAQETNGSIAYKYITSSGYGYVKPGFGLPPAIGDSLTTASAQHNLQAVSIPALLTYRIKKNKISIAPSAGITANFITSAKVKTEVEDAFNRENVTINKLYGLKHFYFGLIADINFQYNFNNQWAINVLPVFKTAISPITKNNVVKTFPNSFGLGTGITYKF